MAKSNSINQMQTMQLEVSAPYRNNKENLLLLLVK